jgi:hypothetical protein
MNNSRFTAFIPMGYVAKGKPKGKMLQGPPGALQSHFISTVTIGNPSPSSMRCAQSSGYESLLTNGINRKKETK